MKIKNEPKQMQYKVKAHGNKNKGDNKVNKTIVK
jgi:hypothetical protein